MKKTIILFTAIILLAATAQASYFEIKASFFIPSETAFKDIYGSGLSYGGEIGFTLIPGVALWAGGEYYAADGELTFSEEPTEIQIIPFWAGLKLSLPEAKIAPYVGLGVGYFLYKESNAIGTIDDGKIGLIGQAGVMFKVLTSMFVDIQGNYSICKVKPEDVEADLGGLRATVGIGFEF